MSVRDWRKTPVFLARGVLYLLVTIHLILPFTPVNPHPELRIKIAGIILAALFLTLGIRSLRKSNSSFKSGLALLLIVYLVSAATGASSLGEGLIVKIVFASLLGAGIYSTRGKIARPTAS